MLNLNHYNLNNINHPDYAFNPFCSYVRYKINKEYKGLFGLEYITVSKNQIGEELKLDYEYSYGLLFNVKYNNFLVIDIDKVPTKFEINNKIYKFNNILESIIFISEQLKIKYNMIDEINIYTSSILKLINQNTNEETLTIGIHMYIKLNDYYNTTEIYNSKIISDFICKGHLTFISNNGYNNIRISPKFNNTESKKLNFNYIAKYDSNIMPLISFTKNSTITYSMYDYIKNYKKENK